MRTLGFIILLALSLQAAPAHAQFATDSFGTPTAGIELQPPFPRPGETVTATLNNYGSGPSASAINWYLDGAIIPESANRRSVELVAGEAGVIQTVQVVAADTTYRSTFTPVYLDIIVEPQTRVPDFYLGRALPSIGSIVNVTALISGNGFRNPDLVYTWRLGRQVLEGGPIRGRSQVSFPATRDPFMTLSVEVADLTGNVIARRAILVPTVSPELHFYEVSSLFGEDHIAIDDGFNLIGNSTVIRAEPYYLDSRVFNEPDITEWSVNSQEVGTTGSNPYEVTIRRTGGGGRSNLSFHVRDMTTVLQGAQDGLSITF